MATLLRIFDVPNVTAGNERPVPVERDARVELTGDGDSAKRAAKTNLREMGLTVRSLNWAPTPNGAPELVAYVSKKEA